MLARRSTLLAPAAVLLVAALAACGAPQRITPSSKALPRALGGPTPTVFPAKPSSAAPAAPGATGAPAATGSASPSGQPGGQPGGSGDAVLAGADNKFTPAELTVPKGTKVTWTASGFHSVTGGTNGKADPSSPMKSELGFTTYSVTFDKPGSYPYFCEPHATIGMVGEIVVT